MTKITEKNLEDSIRDGSVVYHYDTYEEAKNAKDDLTADRRYSYIKIEKTSKGYDVVCHERY